VHHQYLEQAKMISQILNNKEITVQNINTCINLIKTAKNSSVGFAAQSN
jgi:hydroxymethylglutaryl-CoA reductase